MFEPDGSVNVTYSLYRALELRPQCTDYDITRAYRKLALKYHPDKAGGCPDKFNQIKNAHDILKDPIKREFYNRFGDNGLRVLSPPDGSPTSHVVDTSTFIGRSILKIMARPTRLIPFSLTIALINVCFVLFMYCLDKKLYYNRLKTVPWYSIFSLLWIYLLSFVLIFGFFTFLAIKSFKHYIEMYCNVEEYSKIPAPRRRFFIVVRAICLVFALLSLSILPAIFIYCTMLMAIYFDNDGKLTGGMTWSKLYYPLTVYGNLAAVLLFIFSAVMLIQFHNPERLWKERLIYFVGYAFNTASVIVYSYFIISFFDSNDKSLLIGAYSVLYLSIIYGMFRNHFKTKWEAEDLTKSLVEKHGEDSRERIEVTVKKSLQLQRIYFNVSAGIVLSNVVLQNLHFAGYWPKSWSMTFLISLICVYASIFVFGFALPLILTCMDFVIPPNSFGSFDPPTSPGEEGITVIEIPTRSYKFGFGFAPIQPRIR